MDLLFQVVFIIYHNPIEDFVITVLTAQGSAQYHANPVCPLLYGQVVKTVNDTLNASERN